MKQLTEQLLNEREIFVPPKNVVLSFFFNITLLQLS